MLSEFKLNDSRILAYAEFGDPRGSPVFFFHGTPGSRFFQPPEEITTRMGIRLITADRPGYGKSSFQAHRRLMDWPEDIRQLADHLSVHEFHVAGHSGGGPYAAACAYSMPDRIPAAALVSSPGPMDSRGATKGLSRLNRAGFTYGRYLPRPLWRLLIWVLYHRRKNDPKGEIDRETGHRPAADEEQMGKREVRQVCLISEIEAFRFGMRAFAEDARLLTIPWGFPLDKIQVPVYLWHGTDDNLTSTAMAKSMTASIPGSHLTIYEHEAHLLLFPHWEEILTALMAEQAWQPSTSSRTPTGTGNGTVPSNPLD